MLHASLRSGRHIPSKLSSRRKLVFFDLTLGDPCLEFLLNLSFLRLPHYKFARAGYDKLPTFIGKRFLFDIFTDILVDLLGPGRGASNTNLMRLAAVIDEMFELIQRHRLCERSIV